MAQPINLLFEALSLKHRILLGFGLVLVPLAVLLWQGHQTLNIVGERAVEEARAAISTSRQLERMDGLVVDIERSALQHQVVGTDASLQVARNNLETYRRTLTRICVELVVPACGLHQQYVSTLEESLRADSALNLDDALRNLRTQQSQLSGFVWSYLDERLQRQQDFIQQRQQTMLQLTVFLVLLALVVVVWSTGRISAPVKRLERLIKAIGDDNHQTPPEPVRGPKELNELGVRLTALAQRLRQLEGLRLALLRHASHELKTPLASMQEGCALLSEEIPGPLNERQKEVMGLLTGSMNRLHQLTEQLLDYNQLLQQSQPTMAMVQPKELIDSAIKHQALALQQRGIATTVKCEPAKLDTDRRLFQRILDNLINNALAYGNTGGALLLELTSVSGGVQLTAANTGPAVDPGSRTNLFKPFQRGEARRHDAVPASGLGLSIVADCARLLGGYATMADRAGYDFTVAIFLPTDLQP